MESIIENCWPNNIIEWEISNCEIIVDKNFISCYNPHNIVGFKLFLYQITEYIRRIRIKDRQSARNLQISEFWYYY